MWRCDDSLHNAEAMKPSLDVRRHRLISYMWQLGLCYISSGQLLKYCYHPRYRCCGCVCVCVCVCLCVCPSVNKISPKVMNRFWWIFWRGGAWPRGTNWLDFGGDPIISSPIFFSFHPLIDFQWDSNSLAVFARWQYYNARGIKQGFKNGW